jgi:hypothetical protein
MAANRKLAARKGVVRLRAALPPARDRRRPRMLAGTSRNTLHTKKRMRDSKK